MEQLTLTTPALLFSAISLIMLAYTNRFLAYASVIRNLHDKYLEKKDDALLRQIKNLKQRLNLTRYMQIFGISSLLFCVLTMFLIYVGYQLIAVWCFGFGLILLLLSLLLLIREIQISAKSLQYHIADIEEYLKKNIISSYEKFGFGFYVVRLTEKNTPIGMCGLIKRDWMNYVEIGYAFLTQFRGKGYAIESSIATKEYAKEKFKIGSLAAITDINNKKSGNLLNRLGFKFSKLITYPGEDKKCKLYLENYSISNEVN